MQAWRQRSGTKVAAKWHDSFISVEFQRHLGKYCHGFDGRVSIHEKSRFYNQSRWILTFNEIIVGTIRHAKDVNWKPFKTREKNTRQICDGLAHTV